MREISARAERGHLLPVEPQHFPPQAKTGRGGTTPRYKRRQARLFDLWETLHCDGLPTWLAADATSRANEDAPHEEAEAPVLLAAAAAAVAMGRPATLRSGRRGERRRRRWVRGGGGRIPLHPFRGLVSGHQLHLLFQRRPPAGCSDLDGLRGQGPSRNIPPSVSSVGMRCGRPTPPLRPKKP